MTRVGSSFDRKNLKLNDCPCRLEIGFSTYQILFRTTAPRFNHAESSPRCFLEIVRMRGLLAQSLGRACPCKTHRTQDGCLAQCEVGEVFLSAKGHWSFKEKKIILL